MLLVVVMVIVMSEVPTERRRKSWWWTDVVKTDHLAWTQCLVIYTEVHGESH